VAPAPDGALARARREAAARIDAALRDGDFRRAAAAAWTIVEEANRHIERVRPWELARAERASDAPGRADGAAAGRPDAAPGPLDVALAALVAACRHLGELLGPFLPGTGAAVVARCTPVDGLLPPAGPLFARLEPEAPTESGARPGVGADMLG
jgi:methionyl-tRNA synthetase